HIGWREPCVPTMAFCDLGTGRIWKVNDDDLASGDDQDLCGRESEARCPARHERDLSCDVHSMLTFVSCVVAIMLCGGSKAFDDRGVGHSCAFAHRLEPISAASVFEVVHERRQQPRS